MGLLQEPIILIDTFFCILGGFTPTSPTSEQNPGQQEDGLLFSVEVSGKRMWEGEPGGTETSFSEETQGSYRCGRLFLQRYPHVLH